MPVKEALVEDRVVVVVVVVAAVVVGLEELGNEVPLFTLSTLRSLGFVSSSLDRHDEVTSRPGAGLLLAEAPPGFPDCLASERPEPVVFLSSLELSPPDTSLSRRCLPCTLLAIPIYPYHD